MNTPNRLSITAPEPEMLRNRLFISDSTFPAVHESHLYEPGALIPTPPRHITTEEFRALVIAPEQATLHTTRLLPRSDTLHTYISDIAPHRHSFTDCESGMYATTRNHDDPSRRLVGLHVDNKEGLPLAAREQSGVRLGFNEGEGLRFLLIGGLAVTTMARMLNYSDVFVPTTHTVREYLTAQAVRPLPALCRIVWMALRKGDAYVASTEVFPHDGATLLPGRPQTKLINKGSRISFWLGEYARNVPLG